LVWKLRPRVQRLESLVQNRGVIIVTSLLLVVVVGGGGGGHCIVVAIVFKY
jgi:hypothetical protein